MTKTKTVSTEVDVDVEIDLADFTDEELIQELDDRAVNLVEDEGDLRLLRHGIEDRDWAKIEEFAERLRLKGSNIFPSPCLIERANARAQGGKG